MSLSLFASCQKFMNVFKVTHGQAAQINMPPPELFGLLNATDDFQVEEHPSWVDNKYDGYDDN